MEFVLYFPDKLIYPIICDCIQVGMQITVSSYYQQMVQKPQKLQLRIVLQLLALLFHQIATISSQDHGTLLSYSGRYTGHSLQAQAACQSLPRSQTQAHHLHPVALQQLTWQKKAGGVALRVPYMFYVVTTEK